MATYTRAPDVLTRRVGDEILVLHTTSEVYYGINEAGAFMFEQLCEGKTVDEVVSSTAEEFDAQPDVIAADLAELVAALIERELLQAVA